MNKQNNNILIVDWTGKILFEGSYKSKAVEDVLDANRCECCGEREECYECEGTGYDTDFEIFWEDENREDNVYEFINY